LKGTACKEQGIKGRLGYSFLVVKGVKGLELDPYYSIAKEETDNSA
jgi:hypothetical protein